MEKKLFIISNRLPVHIETVDDVVKVHVSSGGLITAISSYLNAGNQKEQQPTNQNIWIGVPCCSQSEWSKATEVMEEGYYQYLPVFANKKDYDLYYNGLSNSVIWPLFHYFPSYAEYNSQYFESYNSVNKAFLDVVMTSATENDIIWIHDYHLLPLAGMIREQLPHVTIGFFLHIPFPSYELFRLMPGKWQQHMLEGMLGADLIGFHTIEYASHFLQCVQMILGIENEKFILKYKNRLVKTDVFPISIDFHHFNNAYNLKRVANLRKAYKEQFINKKIIFSVDRLDYTKGVQCRLKAYEHFLKTYPEFCGNVIFIMIIVPSRDHISKYNDRKREIDEFIGNINSRIGTILWKPVIYQYTHLDFEELIAMYTACDLALITPIRDGMNLVAKEFVASRKDKRGVLLLSEMAGAAKELTDALTINPNDTEGIAARIKEGLTMDEEEQESRITQMQKRIEQYDVTAWAEDFMTQLEVIKQKQKDFEFMFLDNMSRRNIRDKYVSSEKRLLILDYDGTLVSFHPTPDQSKPDQKLLGLLQTLTSDVHNTVYIVSGRDYQTLDAWLGHLPLHIVSEHGAKQKKAFDPTWYTQQMGEMDDDWKETIETVMKKYEKRCANTFVETKEYAAVWHYRNADQEQAKIRASELFSELGNYTNDLNIQVHAGNKIIEVRVKGVDKGNVVKRILKEDQYDFILACGDDYTDEDMFRVLAHNEHATTIKIGDVASYAHYNLYTPEMTISLLEYLSAAITMRQQPV
jgi:trehalose 6-phosphate synthase/phosphatase